VVDEMPCSASVAANHKAACRYVRCVFGLRLAAISSRNFARASCTVSIDTSREWGTVAQ
jgi:hypothetical protein